MLLTAERKINAFTNTPRLSTSEFQQLARLVYSHCGINLTDNKGVMLESRLNKRLRALNFNSFKDYIEFLTSQDGIETELVHMIDVVTTNKTDFFREPHHFDYLKNILLPDFMSEGRTGKTFRVWSAACSSGEEPYTLAMILQDFAMQTNDFTYSIYGSDISTQVLQKAVLAIYSLEHAAPVPMTFKQRYLLKSKDSDRQTVRVVPQLRNKVQFSYMNLMDSKLDIEGDLDVIFCRNVLIYFDRKTQLEVVNKLTQKLRPGGYLFIGHSESLHNFELPITQLKPTIYIKK